MGGIEPTHPKDYTGLVAVRMSQTTRPLLPCHSTPGRSVYFLISLLLRSFFSLLDVLYNLSLQKKLDQLPAVDIQHAPAKLPSKLHMFAYVDFFGTVTVQCA